MLWPEAVSYLIAMMAGLRMAMAIMEQGGSGQGYRKGGADVPGHAVERAGMNSRARNSDHSKIARQKDRKKVSLSL